MDFEKLYDSTHDLITFYLKRIDTSDTGLWMAVAVALIVLVMTFIHVFYRKFRSPDIRIPELEQNRKYRFRKRDKVEFLARKVLRKGKDTASRLHQQVSKIKEAVPEYSRSGRRLRKRERMFILAKRMFRVKQEPPKLRKKELPSSMLEADLHEELSPNLPEEVMYLLQSVKVFGHFEKGFFLQLCRHMETMKVEKDKYLFRVGEPDEYMYVVQEGQINLYIKDDGLEVKLSEITAGESLHSLLSILDVLTGHSSTYKTVFARAVTDSIVIRLPVGAFNIAFENSKDALVQIVQVVMTRMQRVTFLALHNYLGLSQELLNPARTMNTEKLSIHRLSTSMASSASISSEMSQEDEDVPDATALSHKDSLIKTKSHPILSSLKSKQLRFGEYDTIVDDNDNVFRRQSSLPAENKDRLNLNLRDVIKQASKLDTSDEVLNEVPNFNHRDSVTSTCTSSDAPLSINFNRSSLSQEGFSDTKMQVDELEEPEILELVMQDLLVLFGIDDKEMLNDKITLLQVPQNYELIQEGDQEVSLYFVVTGALCVYQMQQPIMEQGLQKVTLFMAYPGMLTGQLSVLTGEPSFFAVRAHRDSVIARLRKGDFYRMMQHYPRMVLNTAHTVVQRVSPFVRQIDFALDWTIIEAGKALYKQDTLSDCMHIVLHGRLRAVHETLNGKKELVSEYGRGEMVGMMEALRGTRRSVSMHAVRDTELAKIPEGLLKHIRRHHPGVVSHLVSLMSDKLMGTMASNRTVNKTHPGELLSHKHKMAEETSFAYGDVSNHLANLSTVAVLPVDRDVPLEKFTMELEHSLGAINDNILRLNSDTIKKRLGQNALDSAQEYRLSGWLAHQEDLHRIVLYQTDDHMSPWTQRCIRQSDAILIVGLGDGEPNVGELELDLQRYAVRALKVLVILHRPEVSQPKRTVEWLNMRGWLTQHLHIKGSKRLFARTRKSKMNEYYEKLNRRDVDRFSDFSRLARFLTGTSVALVLGGGGARGLSQIGIIKALLEAGIPIDLIGGTSIGAFMGALWAGHRDIAMVRSKTAAFSSEMSSFLSKLFDLTYPITSMFSGNSFNNGIHSVFKETQIEDLWLPYYTITTDITSSKMRVHTDGSLWRYVRASMSLSGYLPPLCDPKDGHLLMDGGYINNLPGDVARSRGASRVIAVDVGAATETDFTNYGDYLSGWWVLWKKWTGRWTGRIKVPDMNEIQARLSYISCQYLMELVISSDYCTYLRPPVVKYSTLEFNKWEELLGVGYAYGTSVFTEEWASKFWRDLQGGCDQQKSDSDEQQQQLLPQRKSSIANLKANTSFTDLAELMKHREEVDASKFYSDISDLEFEIGYESSPELVLERQLVKRTLSEPLSEMEDSYGRLTSRDILTTSDEEDDNDDYDDQMRRFSSSNVLSSSL